MSSGLTQSGPAGKLHNHFNNAMMSACGTPDTWSILRPHSELPASEIRMKSSTSRDVASRHRVAGSRHFESTKWSHRHGSKCPMTLITNHQWQGALSRKTKTLIAPLRKPRNSQSAILLYQAQNNVQTYHHKISHEHLVIIISSNLSNDRSKASSKTIPPHSAI